jgi:hypothetical protein
MNFYRILGPNEAQQLLMLCLDVILQLCSLSRRESFLKSASLGQGAVIDRRVFSLSQIIFILYLSLKTL